MSVGLIKHWVDVASDQGQRLIENPDASFALYDPADHPTFAPREWNARTGTNCYAYAMQAPAEIMFPGFVHKGKDAEKYRLADIYNSAFAASPSVSMSDFKGAVYRGMERDGLMQADPDALYKEDHYLIALCFSEIESHNIKDFHFLVLNSNGLWSEINGAGGHVGWTDLHDESIANPATAKFAHTMNFDSLYHVPKGGAASLREQRLSDATQQHSYALLRP